MRDIQAAEEVCAEEAKGVRWLKTAVKRMAAKYIGVPRGYKGRRDTQL